MFASFTPSARIIWTLSPVARIAVPRLVRKNTYSTTPDDARRARPQQHRSVAHADLPAAQVKLVAPRMSRRRSAPLRSRAWSPRAAEIALAHHVQVDRVERGHHQDPGEQPVNLEARMQRAGDGPGSIAGEEGCQRASRRVDAVQPAASRQPCAEGDRSIGGDIRNAKIRKLMNTPSASSERMKPIVNVPISRFISAFDAHLISVAAPIQHAPQTKTRSAGGPASLAVVGQQVEYALQSFGLE